MQLSRKRKKELKKLRQNAEYLLGQQKELLGHAGSVLAEATHQAKALGNEKIMPVVNDKMENVRPFIDRNINRARKAADRIKVTAAPVVAAALAKTIATLDSIDSSDKAQKLQSYAESQGLIKPKKSKVKGFFAVTLGVTAAAAVAYSLWQAFREDDEDMWVSSD